MGIYSYATEALRKVCSLLKVATPQKEKLPSSTGDHPKLDSITLLGEDHHYLIRRLLA